MAAQLISILSQNNEENEKLKNNFESSNYQISVFNNIDILTKDSASNHPILIMIDYSSIVSADRSKVISLFKIVKSTRAIVFNVPEDTDRRLAFYELGATRVFDKSYALENISHGVLWLANVLSNSDDSKRLYSKGQLEDISLTTLINTLGSESRSGILKIVTENNSGKIYFNDGDIISAEVGFHRGEKAIIHMLFWDKGDFSFSSSQNEAPERTIETSNIGIQIISKIYQNKFRINMEKLGKPTSTLRAQNVGDLEATFEDIDSKFIDYISRPKNIDEVLENSYYTCFETLELLVKLKEYNFLLLKDRLKTVSDDSEIKETVPEVEQKTKSNFLFQTQDVEEIKKNLKLKEGKSFNVLLINSQNFDTDGFIEDLGESVLQVKRQKKYRELKIAISDQSDMLLYTLRVNKDVVNTFKQLPEEISGQIFLIELSDNFDFEYMNYVIRNIYTINKAPTVLAVSNAGTVKNLSKIKPKFNVPEHIKIIPFDQKKRQKSIIKAILSLKPVDTVKTK